VLVSGAVVLLLAFAAAGFFYLKDSDRTGTPWRNPTERHAAVPRFEFHVGSVRAIPTGEKGGIYIAKKAVANIRSTLNRLYRTAFLDPDAWETGQYGDIWTLFDHSTLPEARSDLATLTLGENAGSVYETVLPSRGRMRVRVLLDHAGNPSTAVAIVSFKASGDQTRGRLAAIHSKGQYFLRPAENSWSIYGYDLERQDEPIAFFTQGSPSP
jgi:hypothetical protein